MLYHIIVNEAIINLNLPKTKLLYIKMMIFI
jgi:hypothetical protein